MEKKTPENGYAQKLHNFAVSELTGKLWQFARGIVQLSSSATWGPVGTASVTALFAGLSVFRHNSVYKQGKQKLLQLYKNEIAEITRKDPEKLVLSDVDKAAAFSPNGSKNAIALELDAAKKNGDINLTASLVSITGVAVLGLAVASLLPASLLTGSGFQIASLAFGSMSNLIFMSVDHFVSNAKGGRPNYNFNAELNDIVAQSKSGEVKPERVFGLLLKTNPTVAEQINQTYPESYAQLPVAQKSAVVEKYEEIIHAKKYAGLINGLEMNPQELGFIAYGQSSGLANIKMEMSADHQAVPDLSSHFTGKILEERALESANQRTLH